MSSRTPAFQHDARLIAVSLRFQVVGFLAHYAVMQQSPTDLSVESTSTSSADTPIQLRGNVAPTTDNSLANIAGLPAVLPTEVGGRDGPDPTRFGDWEKAGRCIDF